MEMIATEMKNDERQDKNHPESLSRLEKFGLVSSIVGLVADGIALTTFVVDLWGLSTEETTPAGLMLFYILSILLIFYSWIALSWILTRRGLNFIPKKKRCENLVTLTGQSVTSIGIGILPLYIVWLVAIGLTDPGGFIFLVLFLFPIVGMGIFLSVGFLLSLVYQDLADTRFF